MRDKRRERNKLVISSLQFKRTWRFGCGKERKNKHKVWKQRVEKAESGLILSTNERQAWIRYNLRDDNSDQDKKIGWLCTQGMSQTGSRLVSNKPFPSQPYMAPYMGLYGPLWPHKEVSLISKMALTRLGTLRTGQWSSQDGLGIQTKKASGCVILCRVD